jgi:hypothetical protein
LSTRIRDAAVVERLEALVANQFSATSATSFHPWANPATSPAGMGGASSTPSKGPAQQTVDADHA